MHLLSQQPRCKQRGINLSALHSSRVLTHIHSKYLSLPIVYRCIAGILFALLVGILAYHIVSDASSKPTAARHYEVGYKSVRITSEDTLWGIACRSYSPEYGTLEDYIQEIMRCNAMKSEYIQAGCFLIVPVYISVS